MEYQNEPSQNLSSALKFLGLGLAVVPIAAGTKRPPLAWAQFQKRHPSRDELASWFEIWPDAGVGIICGQVSEGLFVLDVDPRNGGNDSIRGRHLPITPCVRTGGGGLHYYFKAFPIPKKGTILSGLDVQGEGALVVAPPSIHPNGTKYEWVEGLGIGEVELAPPPSWIGEELAKAKSKNIVAGSGQAPEVPIGIPEGQRHTELTRQAGRLLGKKLSEREVSIQLHALNATFKPPLPQREVDGIVHSLAAKESRKTPQSRTRMTASFTDLVDVVAHNESPAFLVKRNAGSPVIIDQRQDEDGTTWVCPSRESLPWLLPRSSEVLSHHEQALRLGFPQADADLFADLIRYHEEASDLPDPAHYTLLAAFDMHTYLLEHFQYSPILCFFAVPERGKSRTGKAIIYVASHGLHVESLRDAYLVRAAHDLKATIFFDVFELWDKAEKAGSQDILLHRFERGGQVARVNNPERGAFEDTTYYSVFGPTIIATNTPVHRILDTRCLPIQMQDSSRIFPKDITPENSLPLKERLVAFRLRHLGEPLPNVEKPTRGRLGDITRPLCQIIQLASPGFMSQFRDLIQKMEQGRLMDKSDSPEAQVIRAVIDLEPAVNNGALPVKNITEQVNNDKTDRQKWSPQRVGRILGSLGFQKSRTGEGNSAILYESPKIQHLAQRYGLEKPSETPGIPGMAPTPGRPAPAQLQMPPEGTILDPETGFSEAPGDTGDTGDQQWGLEWR